MRPPLLGELASRGIQIHLAGDDLKLAGTRAAMTPALLEALRADKPQLVAWLRLVETLPVLPPSEMQIAYLAGRDGALALGGVAAHVYHEIDGVWDVQRLTDAFHRVIGRHDALRMMISAEAVRVLPAGLVRPEIPVADLTGLSETERQAALATMRAAMSHQVMDPEQAPLAQLRLSVLTPELMRLHVSHDGLIIDGMSMYILFRDLAVAYHQPEVCRPPLRVGFADQLKALAAPPRHATLAAAEAYWRAHAQSLPPAPALPLARDPASITRPVSERHLVRLTSAQWRLFQAAAQAIGLTPPAALGAAFCEVLSRWSGGADFSLNMTIANRIPLDMDMFEVIGVFTQPLPVAFRAAPTALERAQKFQGEMASGIEHRLVSGIQIAQKFAGANGLKLPVTFNCAIDGLAAGVEGAALSGLGHRVYAVSQTPQVWLNAFVLDTGDGLTIEFDAVQDLFPAGLLTDLATAYEGLLRRLTAPAAWRHAEFDLLPARQAALRSDINATAAPIPPGLLQDAFLAQAEAAPAAPALIGPDAELSYGALARRAAAIAAWLITRRLAADELVGVVMQKGWEQIAAALGILMAGGAYLPIAADLPPARIRALLDQGEARCVLVQPGGQDLLPAAISPDDVLMINDRLAADPTPFMPERRAVRSQDDLAYVLFTSGSTGVPKGVMISHRSAVNLVHDINTRFQVNPADRIFGLSAFNFDLSVFDIFGALSAGAALVLPAAPDITDPAAWAAQAEVCGVSIWNSVPQLIQLLLDHAPDALPSALRLVMLSGDKIPVALAAALRKALPEGALVSLGGPTETTVWNIFHRIEALPDSAVSVPYGRPNANNRYTILDARGSTCPDWVVGELHAAGAGLARGYWRDEARTAAAFFTHPATGERLYATGDLGRYLPSGDIDIAGRRDFQVKINGVRVELGEIETLLARHPAVKDAAAVAITSPAGPVLAAFITAKADMTDTELADYLAVSLPATMVPSRFIRLPALPLTANGKVDRKALSQTSLAAAPAPAAAPPSSPAEIQLAEIWSGLLKTRISDVHADFYALGGTSLTAMRLVAAITRQFNMRVSLKAFNRLPTIAALARHIETLAADPAPAKCPAFAEARS